jgi:hypothetical protein
MTFLCDRTLPITMEGHSAPEVPYRDFYLDLHSFQPGTAVRTRENDPVPLRSKGHDHLPKWNLAWKGCATGGRRRKRTFLSPYRLTAITARGQSNHCVQFPFEFRCQIARPIAYNFASNFCEPSISGSLPIDGHTSLRISIKVTNSADLVTWRRARAKLQAFLTVTTPP